MSEIPPVYFCGIYTVTPMHCGTGQANAVADLPIAREPHTGFPALPASSLKGAWRALCRGQQDEMSEHKDLAAVFGPLAKSPSGGSEGSSGQSSPGGDDALAVGEVNFLDGMLLAFPVRAIHTSFVYLTCPLVIERYLRLLRMFDTRVPEPAALAELGSLADYPFVCPADESAVSRKELVLEDVALVVKSQHQPRIAMLAKDWSRWVPANSAKRFESTLVLVDTLTFRDLVTRTTPVQARVKLNGHKTTGSAGDASGNLWYEETLPADCLFVQPIAARVAAQRSALEKFGSLVKNQSSSTDGSRIKIQIGGNETVGQGFCIATLFSELTGPMAKEGAHRG